MDWELARHELLFVSISGLIFLKFGSTGKSILSTAEAITMSKVLKYALTEMPR